MLTSPLTPPMSIRAVSERGRLPGLQSGLGSEHARGSHCHAGCQGAPDGRPDSAVDLAVQTAILLRMTADHLVSIERIRRARETIAERVHRTPLLSSSTAARAAGQALGVRLADDRLWIKAENFQKTGSFKPRGMTAKVLALTSGERARGIITLSAGNAAQAYAFAGRAAGVRVTVVMPAAAVRSKVDACLGYGAEVVLHGATVGEALAEMERIRDDRGLVYCPPFDDPEVIAGHGSVGLEILDDLPDVDVIVVGVGGGGLIGGIASAVRALRPSVRFIGVEPVGSQAMTAAIEADQVVPVVSRTVADGLGAPFAGEWTLAIVRREVEEIVVLDDAEILAGVRFAAERVKIILEPAGAAALAAVLLGRIRIRNGERVAVVASGGNVEIGRLGELFAAAATVPVA